MRFFANKTSQNFFDATISHSSNRLPLFSSERVENPHHISIYLFDVVNSCFNKARNFNFSYSLSLSFASPRVAPRKIINDTVFFVHAKTNTQHAAGKMFLKKILCNVSIVNECLCFSSRAPMLYSWGWNKKKRCFFAISLHTELIA